MNDSFLMCFLERFLNRNRTAFNPAGQRFSRNQFHHQEVAAAGFFDSVDRSDVSDAT